MTVVAAIRPLVMASLLVAGATHAADDAVVEQLRTDVRTLEREVRELSRRLDQLQQAPRAAVVPPGATRLATASDPDPRAWLAPDKWDKVTTGMTAQQVIVVLGAPVSMRAGETPGSQTLFYTLPIGDTGFLTGTIKLQGDRVAEVRRPELRQVGK
jgi:outer membrane murein-binding lipoprotein Lpp